METISCAGLDVLVRKGKPNKAGVIFLHGYGANYHDLAPLAQYLDPSEELTWYFPNAPISLDANPYFDSRGWFPIDMMRLQHALTTGDVSYFARHLPEGFEDASHAVRRCSLHIQAEHSSLILGGFSQGSMLAADVGLDARLKIDRLVLLSTSLVNEGHWRKLLSGSTAHPRIFQSHGQTDPVLPYAAALQVLELLKEYGVDVEFHSFPDGHTIPAPVLDALKKFLNLA